MEVYRNIFMVTLFHSYASLDVTSRAYKGHGLFTSIEKGALYLDKGEQTQANIVLEFFLFTLHTIPIATVLCQNDFTYYFCLARNWKENKCHILQVKCAIFEDCEETVLSSGYILDCSIHAHPISCLPVNYSGLGTQN